MTKELIDEALRWANGHPNRRSSELMRELAEALEVRQPSEEGEYIPRLIETIKQTGGSVEIHGVKIVPCDEYGRTAAVPDVATEEAFKKAEAFDKAVALSERRQTLLEAAEAGRDAATAAIERVRAVLAEERAWHEHLIESGDAVPRTVVGIGKVEAALDGAPEPETLELFPGTNAALDRLTVRKDEDANAFCIEHGTFHAVELGDPTCQFEDGFGEPVEGEQP